MTHSAQHPPGGTLGRWLGQWLLLLAAWSLALGAGLAWGGERPEPKILILNSYHHGYQGSDELVGGIRDVLGSRFPGAEVSVEYLDTKRFSGPDYDARLLDLLAYKYGERHFDLVLSTDDYAFNLLERHRDTLFKGTPVVFCGTNAFDRARIAGRSGFAGVDERPSFADTLALIFNLHPEAREVVAITDGTLTGRLNLEEFKRAAQGLDGMVRITPLAGMPVEDVVERLKTAGPATVAVYFASVLANREGVTFLSNEGLRQISTAVRVPIYGGWAFNLGHGIIGGRLVSLVEHGRAAGQMAVELLEGKALTGDLVKPSPNPYLFDHAQLQRFGIDPGKLPLGSRLINQPPSFLDRYGLGLLSMLCLGLLLAVGVAFLRLVDSRRALALSELKFSTIFRTSPDIMAISDRATGTFIAVNDAFTRILGFTQEEVLGRTSGEVGTWGSPAERVRLLEALGAGRRLSNFETLFKRKDGRVFPALLSCEVQPIDERDCLMISARDITDLREAQQRLRDSELRYRQMAENLSDWIWSVDLAGRLTYTNRRGPELFGLSPQELQAMDPLTLVHPEDREGYTRILARAVAERSGWSGVTLRWRDAAGSWRCLDSNATPILDERGQLTGFQGVDRDVTERQRTEAELAEYRRGLERLVEERTQELVAQRGRLETILNGLPGLVAYWDRDLCNQYANSAYLEFTGLSAEDIRGRPFLAVFGAERTAHLQPRLEGVLRGKPQLFEDHLASPASLGEWRDFEMHYLPHTQGDRVAGFFVMGFDISVLKEAMRQAQSASAAKGAFLANMSHEIRTPLNGIIGLAHLLKQSGLSAEQAERIVRIEAAGRHLREVIGAILDFSKIEANRIELEESPVSIPAIASTAMVLLQERARGKGVDLVLDLSPGLDNLRGDATRLQQALLNYLNNAIKFTDQGRVTLRSRVEGEGAGGVLVRFEVEDTGIGIPPDKADQVFKAFEQADTSTTREYGGTGLGLAITRKLAELMGGTAGMSSLPGQGSTFWFTAWLKRGAPLAAAPGPDSEGRAEVVLQQRHRGRRILLAEDDEVSREVAGEFLESVGLQVDSAKDGLEAVDLAAQREYDLVLMDMQMPRLDGLQATARIRKLPGGARLPIVALTANAFAEDRTSCLAAGMNDFITKPVDPEAFFATVLRWLSARAKAEPSAASS